MSRTDPDEVNQSMIHWPLLVKHHDDVTVLLIDNLSSWQQECAYLANQPLQLVDSQGSCYRLVGKDFQAMQTHIPLTRLKQWVADYASHTGYCCSAKIEARDIGQLFEMLRYLEQH